MFQNDRIDLSACRVELSRNRLRIHRCVRTDRRKAARWFDRAVSREYGGDELDRVLPFHKLLPSHVVGIVSLVVLGIAILARYARHLTGAWRWIYAVNVVIGLYMNVFVLVAQVFQKVPALKAMAPTQSEAPFVVAQVVVMALFVVLGILVVKRFHDRVGRGGVAFG